MFITNLEEFMTLQKGHISDAAKVKFVRWTINDEFPENISINDEISMRWMLLFVLEILAFFRTKRGVSFDIFCPKNWVLKNHFTRR